MINLKEYIKTIPDYPKKGILFRDISPLLGSGEALHYVTKKLATLAAKADVIVGPDARGFLFGTPVAVMLKKPFVMVRKPGKLPGKVFTFKYKLEYGENSLEMQHDAIKPGQKVVIIDDLLATGGTTRAIVDLLTKQGAEVIKVLFVIELKGLNGRKKYNNIDTVSLIEYD